MMPRTLMIALLVLTACRSTTDNGNSTLSVKGNWTYSAVQNAPSLNIAGTLRIDQQNGSDFSGSAQFSETDVQGTVRTRTGQISGRVIGSDAVDFDMFVETATRRHVARVVRDSMGGTWAVTSGGAAVTGSFTAKRVQ